VKDAEEIRFPTPFYRRPCQRPSAFLRLLSLSEFLLVSVCADLVGVCESSALVQEKFEICDRAGGRNRAPSSARPNALQRSQ
jgi:hypothetical protein